MEPEPAGYGNTISSSQWRADHSFSSACNRCRVQQECASQARSLIGYSVRDDSPVRVALTARRIENETRLTLEDIEAESALIRMRERNGFLFEKKQEIVQIQPEPVKVPDTVKEPEPVIAKVSPIPLKWYDMPPPLLDKDLQASKKAEEDIVLLEKKLSSARRKLRLLTENAKWSSAEVVTKTSGVFLCAYPISIEYGKVLRDLSLESVTVFSEISGEASLSSMDKSLAEEISSLLEKAEESVQSQAKPANQATESTPLLRRVQ